MKFNNFLAAEADHMVVMALRVGLLVKIAFAVAGRLLDDTGFQKQRQITIDGGSRNTLAPLFEAPVKAVGVEMEIDALNFFVDMLPLVRVFKTFSMQKFFELLEGMF